ncbi:G-type lectin S-receptor-like serine/threonine-protein kinase At4g27290 [Aristolochia californica]|uniref:G-type lectin S-receptor-like serine/threonine-protein kinase At4g27290 n=1 Tax=Aristolochia californica TaxID=171875 RepID=UPI0035DFE75D
MNYPVAFAGNNGLCGSQIQVPCPMGLPPDGSPAGNDTETDLWFSWPGAVTRFCAAEEILTSGSSLGINQTLISRGGTYAFGFFKPGNSTKTYVGIWYNSIPVQEFVWVADRNAPVTDTTSAVITINSDGNIVVLEKKGNVIQLSNGSLQKKNTSAVLLESGNLVLRDEEEGILWQSFDYPTDSYLGGWEFKMNLTSGVTKNLVSWKDENDPSPGEFSFGLDPDWPFQTVLKKGSVKVFRSRSNNPAIVKEFLAREKGINLTISEVKDELAISYSRFNSSDLSRAMVTSSGSFTYLIWKEDSKSWAAITTSPSIPCHSYAHCGPSGVCSSAQSPQCVCLKGFEPQKRVNWDKGNWSAGCVRRAPLACNTTDGFIKMENMKLPDIPTSLGSLTNSECQSQCLGDCSCRAYSLVDVVVEPLPRCLIWTRDLIDLEMNNSIGEDLYIRLASSELGTTNFSKGSLNDGEPQKRRRIIAILISAVSVGMFISFILGYFSWRRLRQGREQRIDHGIGESIQDLPFFSFSTISVATDNFSQQNMLGQGGFGPVYKGRMPNGEEVAVKRLSKTSGQGLEEFKNEVQLIAKLQHKNLVRLLGWCIHGEEKILIYEFMPNRSLDKFIFDTNGKAKVDWGKRFHIAQEIAQGLLYLHRFSRLRIIHRDLKASNILLDDAMNPKISDFGMARIFGGNQIEGNTNRVVGTFGYMAPEYALDGLFSEKSDVFSFGVLLLEIVSGKRSSGMSSYDHSVSFLGHVWSLWRESKSLELIDSSLCDSFLPHEAERCIHVGLLCVQESPANRPNMSSVVSMLGNENAAMPSPRQPAFFNSGATTSQSTSDSTPLMYFSSEESNITVLQPR